MKLYTYEEHGVSGYDLKDIETYCKERGTWERFTHWFRGQTGAYIDGRSIVYVWDFERFERHLPPLD